MRGQNHLVTRLSLMLFGLLFANASYAQRGPAVVEVMPISRELESTSQPILGTITPTQRAVIGSAVDGRVDEFLVRAGDRVEEDQKLAILLTQTIKLERAAARAELVLRKSELEELSNGSLPAEIAQAKARLEASRVTSEYLNKRRLRLTELDAKSAISASENEDATGLWLAALQSFEEAQAAYQLALDGPRLERVKQAEARVDTQKAIVKRLTDQIKKHSLHSRFAGYVTREYTEIGQWLARGEPVAEIIALDEVFVVANVVEANIGFVKVGVSVLVQVPAIGRSTSGVVEAIIPEADPLSRTFPVKVLVKNQFSEVGEPLLKAGMLARVTFSTNEAKVTTMVPKDALVLNGDSTMIWIIDPSSIQPGQGNRMEGNAIAALVETGIEKDSRIEVLVYRPLETGIEKDSRIEMLVDQPSDTLVVTLGNERILPPTPGQPPPRVTWTQPQATPTK